MRDLDEMLQTAARAGRDAARPAGPADIRRVGAHMRRVRAASTATLAAVAVTGVVVLVQTSTSPAAAPDYAGRPTATSSSTTGPDGNPVGILPVEDHLLTTETIQAEYGAAGTLTWSTGAEEYPSSCRPTGSDAATATAEQQFTADVEPSVVHQTAETYETQAEATTRLADLRAFYGQCATDLDPVDLFLAFTIEGVGDGGFVVVMTEPDPSPDLEQYVVVRAAQTGPAVTWLVQGYLGNEYHGRPAMEVLTPAVDLLCAPLESACAADPVLTQTYPDADGEVVPGLLTVQDVNTYLDGRWRAKAGLEPDPGSPGVACSVAAFLDAGGTGLTSRGFFDEDDETLPQVTELTETRASFGSIAAAVDYVGQQLVAFAACEGGAVEPLEVGTGLPGWRIDFGDSQLYVGFPRWGAHVAFVEWRTLALDDASFGELFDAAAGRLSELG